MLSSNQLEKYKAIYKQVYGKDISTEDALKQGNALVDLVRLIAFPRKQSTNKAFHEISGQQVKS